MALEVNGKTYETDEEGYLANLNDGIQMLQMQWLKSMALL